jgi:hypothetical protein
VRTHRVELRPPKRGETFVTSCYTVKAEVDYDDFEADERWVVVPDAGPTIWLVFGFHDPAPGDPDVRAVCTSFRIHIGPLTEKVMKQVVTSMRAEVKKNGMPLSWIETRPQKNVPTDHGHQRWANAWGYEETLWASREWLRARDEAWKRRERWECPSCPHDFTEPGTCDVCGRTLRKVVA